MQSKVPVKIVFSAAIVVAIVGFLASYYGMLSFRRSGHLLIDSNDVVRLVEFSNREIHAGRIYSLSQKNFSFPLHNVTTEAVDIEIVAPDCTCTIVNYERTVNPGAMSEIDVSIQPTPHKTRYAVNVSARQGRKVQAETLAVVFEVVKQNRVFFNPPTVIMGELIAGQPFELTRTVRIADSGGETIDPVAVEGSEWIRVGFSCDKGSVTLQFSGVAPESTDINRGTIELELPKPFGRELLHLAYSLRPRYLVSPYRLFGFSDGDDAVERTVQVKGIGAGETLEYQVTMESQGSVLITPEPTVGHMRLAPVYPEGVDEISGKVAWTVYSESKEMIGECQSEFIFLRGVPLDKRHDQD